MAKRRHLCGLLLAACVPALALAQTDAWPSRPIHLVVAYPPGGATDVAGRLLAEALGRRLGQPVIIDNRAGAGGTIGAQSVVRAEPDGYTLLLAASPEVSIAPVTMKAMPYDPVKDLQPVDAGRLGARSCWWSTPACRRTRCRSSSPTRRRIRASSTTRRSARTRPITWPASCSSRWRRSTPCTFPYKGSGAVDHRPARRPGPVHLRHAAGGARDSQGGQAARARRGRQRAAAPAADGADVRRGGPAGLRRRHLVRPAGTGEARRARSSTRSMPPPSSLLAGARAAPGVGRARHRRRGLEPPEAVRPVHPRRDRQVESARRQDRHRRRNRVATMMRTLLTNATLIDCVEPDGAAPRPAC